MSEANEVPPKLIPDPDGRNADFYAHLAGGTLCIQSCASCDASQHPPRYLCTRCGSRDLEWRPASGRGRIFSWTVSHRPVDPAWAVDGPWATLVVEMEEGVRLVGGLRGLDPSQLRLDLPVEVEIEPATEAFAFIYFRPVPE